MTNPNAKVAGATTLLTSAILWLCAQRGWHLSEQWALYAAGGAITAILWVGKHGLKGAWQRIVSGAGVVVNGKPPAK